MSQYNLKGHSKVLPCEELFIFYKTKYAKNGKMEEVMAKIRNLYL